MAEEEIQARESIRTQQQQWKTEEHIAEEASSPLGVEEKH